MIHPCSACDGYGIIRFNGKVRICWLCAGKGFYDDQPEIKPVVPPQPSFTEKDLNCPQKEEN